MPQETNLNVNPYFDDFDKDKNFYKVLFKPGTPVQARELSTLQSILQNQIEQFGTHFFKEGSKVIPGNLSYDNNFQCIQIEETFLGIPVELYSDQLKGIRITGGRSGVTATIKKVLLSEESVNGNLTLYVKYEKSGASDFSQEKFLDGESLVTSSDLVYGVSVISAGEPFANTLAFGASAVGSAMSVGEGVYFIRGNFVQVANQTLILDQYSNTPSYRVGFDVDEKFVTADEDASLNDNASGFTNYAAPGADRLQITVSLDKKTLDDTNDQNFIEIARIQNGAMQQFVKDVQYNIIRDTLAQRTYDESGDYYVKPFEVFAKESLNNSVGNKGVYTAEQKTQQGSDPSEDLMLLQVSPGKAYIKGYGLEKIATSFIDVPKPRTTREVNDHSIFYECGDPLYVNNVYGSPAVGLGTTATVSLMSHRRSLDVGGTDAENADQKEIGIARLYDFKAQSSSYVNQTTQYETRIFDVKTYTKIQVGLGITTVYQGDTFEGARSGAFGFAVTGGAYDGNVRNINLIDVNGNFLKNERIIINGKPDGRTITKVDNFGFNDVKSLRSFVGVSTFEADVLLGNGRSLNNLVSNNLELSRDGAKGNVGVITAAAQNFVGIITYNNIVSYTLPGMNVPTYNRITGVSTDGETLTLAGITTVPGICDGGVPSGSQMVTDLKIRNTSFRIGQNSYLTPLTHKHIESVDVTTTTLQFRKQYTNISFSGSEFTSPNCGAEYFFQPFDEERYLVSYDDGSVEPLTTDQVIISDDKKTVKFVALSKASGKASLYATLLKGDIKTKLKKINDANVISIVNSNDVASGVGTNTKNDGLTFSKIYGTRVQDEKISLNVPECVSLVAVFESNDSGDADLPGLTLTSYSGPSSNNNDFIIGEQLIGKSSNGVGLFCERPNTTTCGIVQLNPNEFQIGEPVVGQKSGVQGTVVNFTTGDKDITNEFMLNHNDKPTYYDFSYIKRKRGFESPSNRLKVVFKNFYVDTADGGDFYTATSYPKSAFDLIPVNQGYQVKTSSLIDIRPRVTPYSDGSGTYSPFDFRSREFASNNNIPDPLVSEESLIISYNYYQGRRDRLYLDKNSNWVYVQGVPADMPGLPNSIGDALEVCTVDLPAYTDSIKQVKIVRTPHKRFTMADIGRLENRIKNVEYYTRLSLLETDTANLNITDANGLSRFKSGFFVDNFKTHGSHQIAHPDFSASIDAKLGYLRPGHYTTAVDMVVGSKSFVGIGTSANPNVDLSYVDDIDGENVKKTGKLVTLDYQEVPMLKQVYASRVENVNPFLIVYYAGDMTIAPDSDTWMDTHRIDANVTEDTTQYDAVVASMGIDEQTGLSEVDWGAWETQWTSEKVVSEWNMNTTETFDKIHPDNLPDGVVLDLKYVADYGKVLELNGKWVPKGSGWITDAKIEKKMEFEDVQTTSHQSREGIQYQVTPSYNEMSLGDKVLSRDIVPYCRSRNMEVTLNRMKPRTEFYFFFDNVDVTKYCTPKLWEIEMKSGVFQVGETIWCHHAPRTIYFNWHAAFRCAAPNHKEGPYDAPTKVLTLNPYDNAAGVPSVYSTASTLLNIDTASLADMGQSGYYGFSSEGMLLRGRDSGAQATVKRKRLVTDTLGNMKCCFMIPDPNQADNPQFETGTKTLRATTSKTNSTVPGTVTGSAEANYHAKGELETVQEEILSIKVPQIERLTYEEQQVIQGRIETRKVTPAEGADGTQFGATVVEGVQYYDPLAQTFRVDEESGVYLTSVDVYMRDRDAEIPLTMQVRTVETGLPTSKILPFAICVKDPNEVNISEDASVATNFKFESPVYLTGGHEYALVLVTPAENYNCWISRMGEVDISTVDLPEEQQVLISQQPYLGSLFKSQNGTTWDPSQYEDMKFTLYKARFNTAPSVARWFNPSLGIGNGQIPKLIRNPITTLSRKAIVGVGSTFTEFTGLVPGVTISQAGNEGVSAKLVNLAGIATINGSNDLSVINPGVGYTPSSGVFTYNDVSMVAQTGDGTGAVGNVTINNGKVGVVTFSNGGKNFAVGDTLGIGTLGLGNGSGAVVSVGLITSYNTLVLDDIQGDFNIGVGTVMFNNGSATIGIDGKTGIGTTSDGNIGSGCTVSSIDIDPYYDGLHFRVHHREHSMHSFDNFVNIDLIAPDVPSTNLSADFSFNNVSECNVVSSSNFDTFEGVGVGTTNYGLAKIGDEIFSYTGVANGQIVGITTRGMFGSDIESHDSGDQIEKYEYCGVSLARINKTHDLANAASPTVPNDKGLDFYHVKLNLGQQGTKRSGGSFPNLYFKTTKRGGGRDCQASQNIQYETITPNVQSLTPPGTNVGARIRTTSATSIGGDEISFVDNGFESLELGSQNHFSTPRMIASQVNENWRVAEGIPAKKTLTWEILMSSKNPNVSPAIDIERVSAVLTSNRLNNAVTDFAGDSRVCQTGQDPCSSYVSKMVGLNNPASELTVEFAAYKSSSSDIRVFYKTMTEGSTENSLDKNWEPFPGYTNTDQFGKIINPTDNNGLSDQFVPPSIGGEFRGYVYSTRELPPFTKFQLKIDMVGTNQAQPPMIKELRAIALA